MKSTVFRLQRRVLAGVFAAGTLFQFAGCETGQITTTVTLDTEDLLITVVRSAILTPIDNYITDRINDAFGREG